MAGSPFDPTHPIDGEPRYNFRAKAQFGLVQSHDNPSAINTELSQAHGLMLTVENFVVAALTLAKGAVKTEGIVAVATEAGDRAATGAAAPTRAEAFFSAAAVTETTDTLSLEANLISDLRQLSSNLALEKAKRTKSNDTSYPIIFCINKKRYLHLLFKITISTETFSSVQTEHKP
uniref:Uncharacterized protein n=1 Tax=Glossina pallidipes TaxID=7398 RepID=A0A1A9ZJU0_GLOPL